MYVPTPRGLNGYRGMGACSAVTGADGQQRVVCDTPITTEVVTAGGTEVTADAAGNVIFASTPPTLFYGLPIWVGVAAAGVFLLLVAKAGR